MRLVRLASLAAALLAPAAALAQSNVQGSLYSRYGLGDLTGHSTTQGLALGGGGLALTNYAYADATNPAALGRQFLTRFSATGAFQALRIADGAGNTGDRLSGQIGSVAFTFPLRTNRVGIGFQFTPVSRVAYRAAQTGLTTTLPVSAADTVRYTVGFEGNGGLNRIEGGAGLRLAPWLYAGATAGVTFGLLEQGRRTVFSPADYAEQNYLTTTRLAGFTGRLGLIAAFDSLGGSARRLHVAATADLPTALKGRRTLALAPAQLVTPDTLTSSAEGTVELPLRLGVGMAYMPSPRWTVVADARYEPWSGATSDFEFDGYRSASENRYADRTRVSGGIEFIPAGDRYAPTYAQRVAYRAGAYYDTGYVLAPASATGGRGDRLPTVGLTAGLSFPALLPGTSLDLGLEVGQRGTAQTTPVPIVQDRFVKVSLTANIGERWFERPRLN